MTPEPDHWFEPVADHLGAAYLRYSFTKGTEQEVAFLVGALGLEPGMRILDVGCGPGRHAYAFAERGLEVVGIDISQRFVDLAAADAPPGATFRRADARALDLDAEFDAALGAVRSGVDLDGLAAADRAALDDVLQRWKPLLQEAVAGGEADGNVIAPTVVDRVTPDMRLYGEESFGPVLAIVRVDGPEEAVAAANDVPIRPATSSFFSSAIFIVCFLALSGLLILITGR